MTIAAGCVHVSLLHVGIHRQKALVLQPDVMFVSRERSAILNNSVEGPPDLVVEVISEGSQQYDRVSKLEWYRNYHVREYWVIDPEALEIEVIHLDTEPLHRRTYRGGDQSARRCSRILKKPLQGSSPWTNESRIR